MIASMFLTMSAKRFRGFLEDKSTILVDGFLYPVRMGRLRNNIDRYAEAFYQLITDAAQAAQKLESSTYIFEYDSNVDV